jgi:hypothetical protein
MFGQRVRLGQLGVRTTSWSPRSVGVLATTKSGVAKATKIVRGSFDFELLMFDFCGQEFG